MGESLISVASIYDTPSSIFSSILDAAYRVAENLSSPTTLILLTDTNRHSIHHYTRDSVTQTPVEPSFTSPFLGWSVQDVARFLTQNAEGSIVEPGLFLIADEKTAEDGNTLLLVQVQIQKRHDSGLTLRTVRLAAEFVNTEAVAVSIGATGADELLNMVDGDGVFRGGKGNLTERQLPKKGEVARKKQM